MRNNKLFIWLLATLAIAGNVQAQEISESAYPKIPTRGRGFQLTVEGGKMNFTNTEGNYDYNGGHFYSVYGYKINPKFSAGLGFGFDVAKTYHQDGIRSLKLNNTTGTIERSTIVISEDLFVGKFFARGQYRFTDNRFSPFVTCDIGIRLASGLQHMYGEDWLFDEDEAWRYGTSLEEYKAGSLTQLLGKPSIANVFATPAIGFSLRTTNNSYLELKAGYTLSPYVMGKLKSTEYTFNNEQITHIASCQPIKMSAPFISLAFTHTFGVWSDLDESLYEATKARTQEKWKNALIVTGAVLGAAATVAGTISAAQNNNDAATVADKVAGSSNNSKAKANGSNKKKPSASTAINESMLRRTYNDYHGQLSNMKTWPEKYYDSARRVSIQSKMRGIRQQLKDEYGVTIQKSDLEDWGGN